MLNITPIPSYSDNYIWLIHHSDHNSVYVVDPGDSKPVEQYLHKHNLTLAGILVTHRHWDHVTGIAPLCQSFPVEVYGPLCPDIPQVTRALADGDTFNLWGQVNVQVFATPGHMPEHLSYFVVDKAANTDCSESHLFCGDTLFSAGCGRIFTGTHTALKTSLDKFKALPVQTRIYCAHEYTQANLRFAKAVEADNPNLIARIKEVDLLRNKAQPSLPSTIAQELQFNPFLRCDCTTVKHSAENHIGSSLAGELAIFTVLRDWKNSF